MLFLFLFVDYIFHMIITIIIIIVFCVFRATISPVLDIFGVGVKPCVLRIGSMLDGRHYIVLNVLLFTCFVLQLI